LFVDFGCSFIDFVFGVKLVELINRVVVGQHPFRLSILGNSKPLDAELL
jgi:hypothetical protein